MHEKYYCIAWSKLPRSPARTIVLGDTRSIRSKFALLQPAATSEVGEEVCGQVWLDMIACGAALSRQIAPAVATQIFKVPSELVPAFVGEGACVSTS